MLAMCGVVSSFGLAILVSREIGSGKDSYLTYWACLLSSGAFISLFFSLPILALLSGSIIASERANRSIEFMEILPPTRTQMFICKSLVTGGVSAMTLWLSAAAMAISSLLPGQVDVVDAVIAKFPDFSWFVVTNFLIGATGLAGSCFSSNSGLCTLLALAAPIVLQIGLFLLSQQFELSLYVSWLNLFKLSAVTLGTIFICLGWRRFVSVESL